MVYIIYLFLKIYVTMKLSQSIFTVLFTLLTSINIVGQHQDVPSAINVDGIGQYQFEAFTGAGIQESFYNTCYNEDFEDHSIWLKIKDRQNSDLIFDIIPDIANADFDFMVIRTQQNRQENPLVLRCMASGRNVGAFLPLDEKCQGKTGLRTISLDKSEDEGCSESKDSYLAPVRMEEGYDYYLLITTNIESGFTIDFRGQKDTASDLVGKTEFQIEKLMPNPVESQVGIWIQSTKEFNASINIASSNGTIIIEKRVQINKGRNYYIYDISSIDPGAYIVQVVDEENNEVISKGLVKM